jgi:hypothetical protein
MIMMAIIIMLVMLIIMIMITMIMIIPQDFALCIQRTIRCIQHAARAT